MTQANDTFAAIFDLDGTLLNTEWQYTKFYDEVGKTYFDDPQMGARVKGMTLGGMEKTYFEGRQDDFQKMVKSLNEWEHDMQYDYIEGAEQMLEQLSEKHIPMALVTSSAQLKMEQVYRYQPKLRDYFQFILTGDTPINPKPAPDGFLRAMSHLGVPPQRAIVFEDSRVGLQAAKASGAFVVGLATTLTRADVEPLADLVLDNFDGFDIEKVVKQI